MRLLPLTALLALLAMTTDATAADKKRPMQVEDLFKFKRVADPQISPDGKHVVYQVTTVDLEGNKSSTALYLAAADGKTPPKPLTNPNGKKDAHPRWSPDGQTILFESTRTGTPQLFTIQPFAGGEATKITSISTGAGTAIWSPDGRAIAFVSSVRPEFSELPFAEADKKNAEADKAAEDNPVKAKTFTKLFYRHWDSYVEDKRGHLFVITATGSGWSEPHNATPGDRDAYPNSTTFSVGDDFTFTPDGKHLVFAAAPGDGSEAWSTNYDLCRVTLDNKSTKWETLTAENKAADNGPKFSPDGKKLAYRAQKKAGYEADKWELYVVDVKPDGTFATSPKSLTGKLTDGAGTGSQSLDLSVNEFTWRTNDKLAFVAEANGRSFIYHLPITGEIALQEPLAFGSASGVNFSADGNAAAFSHVAMSAPADAWAMTWANGKMSEAKVSTANEKLLAELDLPRPESVKVKVEDGDMQMGVLKPPGFDDKKKWPVAYLVHGGPQGAWEDGWSFRWNPQAWAAQGYVVVMPNPRGSTGFGQKFVDEITGDWGGKCYRDLVAGLDYVEKLPFVDKDRIGTAGASFGGYMMDWFAVNDISKRFKCLISHCSVYNFESMWGTTDELWFDEWEHGGLPWEKPGKYAEFSPHKRAGEMGKHKTPMLVIHNDLDFRCPIGQGHELFSALQRQKVPSRFVNFPDEGHWVTKPKNSLHWHKEVFDWLKKYAPPGGK
ncbi:MAG: prolyl oligopeptidase family serine peptidase [Armatimonadaceae bacterium]